MTWRIAAVAFLLCFGLNNGNLIADGPEDKKKEGTPPAETAEELHEKGRKAPPIDPETRAKSELAKGEKLKEEMPVYLQTHFPLNEEDAKFFQGLILGTPEKAGQALGELMGSIYNAEKKNILENPEVPASKLSCSQYIKPGKLDLEALKDSPFQRYVCAAAMKDSPGGTWPVTEDADFKAFMKAFDEARSLKEAANKFYEQQLEKIAGKEKEFAGKTKPDEIEQLKKERKALVDQMSEAGFKTSDFTNYANSHYSKKAALDPASEVGKKQMPASAAALRLQADVTKDGNLAQTVQIGNEKVNVLVGTVGDDGSYAKWAMQALAKKEASQSKDKLFPGKDNQKVNPVAWDGGAKFEGPKNKADKGATARYELEGEYEPLAKVTPAPPKDDKTTDPATAAEPPHFDVAFKAPGGQDLLSKCNGCHTMDYKNGVFTKDGKTPEQLAKATLYGNSSMPFFAGILEGKPLPKEFDGLSADGLKALKALAEAEKARAAKQPKK